MTILNKTPLANLTGDITQAASTNNDITTKRTGTTFAVTAACKLLPTSSGTNETSVGVTTPVDSLVCIGYSAEFGVGGTGTFNIRILDGTTILQTESKSATANSYKLVQGLFVGIPLSGSRTYNIQCWGPSSNCLLEVAIYVNHVQYTDTHVAEGKKLNEVIKG